MFLLIDGNYSKYDIKRRHLRILLIPLVLSFNYFSYFLCFLFIYFVIFISLFNFPIISQAALRINSYEGGRPDINGRCRLTFKLPNTTP